MMRLASSLAMAYDQAIVANECRKRYGVTFRPIFAALRSDSNARLYDVNGRGVAGSRSMPVPPYRKHLPSVGCPSRIQNDRSSVNASGVIGIASAAADVFVPRTRMT